MNRLFMTTLWVSCSLTQATIAAPQSGSAATKSLTDQVTAKIVEQTNRFREKHDLKPVKVDEKLKKTARQFAEFMAESSKYGHHADGRTPAERAKAAGYNYCIVRENIAYRSGPRPDVKELTDVFVQGWIDSPGHRRNMLADYVTETGVAVAEDGDGKIYAVQLFGRPKSAALKIRITNRAQAAATIVVLAEDSSEDFEVPPNVIMNMTRCRPVSLSLKDSDGKVQVAGSRTLIITTNNAGSLVLQDEVESAK